jgi:hypothetical protein
MVEKYHGVNSQWPEGSNQGRNLKQSPQEAMAGARRLYRLAFKKPFKGEVKLTSGRRYTFIRRGVMYVNPDQDTWQGGGGWHEIVHGLSHYASARLYPNARGHGSQHASVERDMIEHVVASGWLDGKLRRPEKAKPDLKTVRHARVLASIRRWETKLKRAETALRKLKRQKAHYEREKSPSRTMAQGAVLE